MDHSAFKLKVKQASITLGRLRPVKDHTLVTLYGVKTIFKKSDNVTVAMYYWDNSIRCLLIN